MPQLVAGFAFDMRDLITNGSLSEFFDFGTVVEATATTFVVTYADETISEQLTLTGTFGDYVDGYPTTGTITSAEYILNGSVLFTLTDIAISVEAFTQYVMTDDLEGLFTEILAGADDLFGSADDDVLLGFDGDDFLDGWEGNDILEGGAGDDAIAGGLGDDQIFGGDGHDFLGEDSGIDGPFGNDLYDGGAGVDRVTYYAEYGYGVTIDLRNAGAQNTGVYGTDTLVSIEYITATYGDDTLTGGDEANWFWTFNGLDRLTGNGGNDLFTVGLGDKIAAGGSGSDTIEILDLAYEPLYTADGISVSLLLQGQAQATGVGNWTLTGIENLGGAYGSDELTGDANANVLAGYEGDDTLVGGGGADTLAGDGGFDIGFESSAWVLIENPTDWEGWVFGNDHLDGGAGDDRLIGAAGDDVLIGGAGNDIVDGGAGFDIASYAGATSGVTVYLSDSTAQDTGGAGIDTLISIAGVLGSGHGDRLTGSVGNDRLGGAGGDDYLFGEAGHDELEGGAGLDKMYGGTGDDIYIVGDSTDFAYEQAGQGYDRVYATATHILRDNVEELRLQGTAEIDGYGGADANVIYGNAAANRLNGWGGDDKLYGGEGNDSLYGTDGDDRLLGDAGNDRLDGGAGLDKMYGGTGNDIYIARDTTDYAYELVGEGMDTVYAYDTHILRDNVETLRLSGADAINGYGNAGDDTIVGNGAANRLYGEAGDDRLFGGQGDDRLYGRDGNDRLDGGSGFDIFEGGAGMDDFLFRGSDFASATPSGADRIVDFSQAEGDQIHLSTVDADSGLGGNQAFAFIGTGAFTGTAGELRYEHLVDGNTYVSGDTNGDGVADFMIKVDGVHSLTSSDFVL